MKAAKKYFRCEHNGARIKIPSDVVMQKVFGLSSVVQVPRVPAIGSLWSEQGGHVAGHVRGENGLRDYCLIRIDHPDAEFESIWHSKNIDIAGAKNERDGMANTHALIKAGAEIALRAQEIIKTLPFKDAYIGARHEMRLCAINIPDLFDKNCRYATSTQYSAHSAWDQDFAFGDQDYINKDSSARVRLVRRVFLDYSFI
jgi:hypothetical protein